MRHIIGDIVMVFGCCPVGRFEDMTITSLMWWHEDAINRNKPKEAQD